MIDNTRERALLEGPFVLHMIQDDAEALKIITEAGALKKLLSMPECPGRKPGNGSIAATIWPYKNGFVLCMRFWLFPKEEDNGFTACVCNDPERLRDWMRVMVGALETWE
jgi:hypothetical protein